MLRFFLHILRLMVKYLHDTLWWRFYFHMGLGKLRSKGCVSRAYNPYLIVLSLNRDFWPKKASKEKHRKTKVVYKFFIETTGKTLKLTNLQEKKLKIIINHGQFRVLSDSKIRSFALNWE